MAGLKRLCFIRWHLFTFLLLRVVGSVPVPSRIHPVGADSNTLEVSSVLFGSIHRTAYYFLDTILGYPVPQRQSLIIDTGSSVMAFACQDCKACGTHIDPPYDRRMSKSVKALECAAPPIGPQLWLSSRLQRNSNRAQPQCLTCDLSRKQCVYQIAYMEGSSLQGHWYRDVIWVGHGSLPANRSDGIFDQLDIPEALIPVEVDFGCHLEETHLFTGQDASGILGLEVWSYHGPRTFVETILSDLQALSPETEQVFSLCLSADGGIVTFGGTNSRYHEVEPKNNTQGGIKWAQILPDAFAYTVGLLGAQVDGQEAIKVQRPGRKPKDFEALVDSGTTLSYFPFLFYYDIFLGIEEAVMKRTLDETEADVRRLDSHAADDGSGSRLRRSDRFANERKELSDFGFNHKRDFPNDEEVDEQISRLMDKFNALDELADSIQSTEERKIASHRARGFSKKKYGRNLEEDEIEEHELRGPQRARLGPMYREIGAVPRSPIFQREVRVENLVGSSRVEWVPESARHRLTQAVKLTDHAQEECWRFTEGEDDFMYFPNIKLRFGQRSQPEQMVEVNWAPQSYLYRKGTSKFHCLAILPEDLRGECVLGSSFLIGHDVIFDVKALKIGFVDAQCPLVPMNDRPDEFIPYPRSTYKAVYGVEDQTSENATSGEPRKMLPSGSARHSATGFNTLGSLNGQSSRCGSALNFCMLELTLIAVSLLWVS